ncbi:MULTISPECIES: SLC13 family permease [unclassified Rhodococcus (in: high G+C Gram-positive bacteria)]|uniref:SLC13 family permease n=1 Tax=unclassified Rhodococcus (in: high G+C Gram-positive bacteria) TaxID=192944 RepID=UPI0016398226|nr:MULTISPECIES: SLC13 family permease [unclassified Rhodococcus (in: high G+C Gram-positive bacteria)]MBC2642433.1 SLC13 family permease [Rhodococcus sp. 3A]MBC2892824.1 SLC13 family permease [Rhodococcus sp. 4CII]
MVYAISIVALIAIFTVATLTPINMGILAFAGAFVIGGWVSGIPVEDIIDAFPGSTFIIVGGITLLFAIAKTNGTIDLVIEASLRLVRGRRWAILWMMFLLSGLLMALGSVLAVGMLAPIAMPLAAKNKINPFLMGMVISHGALACAFSPINLYGAFINGLMDSTGVGANPLVLFALPFVLNLVIAVVLFLIYGLDLIGHRTPRPAGTAGTEEVSDGGGFGRSSRRSSGGGAPGGNTATLTDREVIEEALSHEGLKPVKMDRYRFATLMGIGFLVVGSVAFGIDVGVSSICISAVLLLMAPKSHPKVIDNVAWPAVVLVCGMLTYMAVMTQNGTLDFLGDAASALGSPLLTALILCYAVAIISAFGSSIGTLGIALPLAAPMLAMGEVGAVGFVAALAFSATVVDVSPFSTNGVMVLANAQVEDKARFQRRMLAYCGLIVLSAPLFVWALVVVPTSV